MWKILNVGFCFFYCKSIDSGFLGIVLNLRVPDQLCLAPLTRILYQISLFLLYSSEILFVICKLSLVSQEEV